MTATAAPDWGAIRVRGARENNLKNVGLDIPKRRLTVFTGVSGSGKSSLVFETIAAESQRLINETYTAFIQSFMGTPARPDVDSLENLSAAIVVDQERMGANARSTVGTVTDAYAMLRIIFSRLGQPHIGPVHRLQLQRAGGAIAGEIKLERGTEQEWEEREFTISGGMCPDCEGLGRVSSVDVEHWSTAKSPSTRARSTSRTTSSAAGRTAPTRSRDSSTRTRSSATTPRRSWSASSTARTRRSRSTAST